MDPADFDTFVRSYAAPGSRRRLLTLLTALLPAAGFVMWLGEAGEARGRGHGRNRGHHPGKGKDNRKGKRKDQGVGRPLDCPDGLIECFKTDDFGNCADIVHTFGPLGRCGNGLSCCPCGHIDQAYWTDYCNQNAPECQQGNKCIAQDGGEFGCFGCQV